MSNILIGVSGGSGSGKTTLIKCILNMVTNKENIEILSYDSYYYSLNRLNDEEKLNYNYDHPDSLDSNLLYNNLCNLINNKKCFEPIYNFKTCLRENNRELIPKPIVIVEGNLLFFEKKIRDLFDVKVFIDIEADIRLIRRIKRDINERGYNYDETLFRYENSVKSMHDLMVEPTKKYADIILQSTYNEIFLKMIVSYIESNI